MPEDLIPFERLGVALALGLLIGLERSWKSRDFGEAGGVAGVRTFGVIGLLGGVSAVLTQLTSPLTLAAVVLALGALLAISHYRAMRRAEDVGSTTVTAALATFALGALAGFGELAVAGAAAVVLTLLLGVKEQLHGFVARIEQRELMAIIQLLVISVVLLPILPDQGYGPYQALNPYTIWWMVVLIVGLSFLGYVAIKAIGPERGVLLLGVLGGFVSSTITTVNLARLARKLDDDKAARLLATGAIAAVATMYPRVLAIVAVVQPTLLAHVVWPLALATLAGLVFVLVGWRRKNDVDDPEWLLPRNPFELGMALRFAAILTTVMLLTRAVEDIVGDAGLYALAGVSGLAEVDAMTLTLSSMAARNEVAMEVASLAIVIAVVANTLVKPALIAALGAPRMAKRTIVALCAASLAALVGVHLPRVIGLV